MEVLILSILIGLIPAKIASNKGYSFKLWWFYGAMLFIVALPWALMLPLNPETEYNVQNSKGLKKCPFCAEYVKQEAVICKHCQKDIKVIDIQQRV